MSCVLDFIRTLFALEVKGIVSHGNPKIRIPFWFYLKFSKVGDMITIDDFKKIELRVAKVLEAERVEGSDKLIKMQLSLGEEKRQVIGGISKHYEPEQLIGRQIIIVANLEPRSLMGLESQGMLLAASDENGIALLMPDKEVSDGSKIN